MQAITFEAARYLATAGAIHGAAIKSIHGRNWAITLLGKVNYMLRSERQNPRTFGTIETAIREIRHLGLTCCELHFDLCQGKASRSRGLRASASASGEEAQFE